MTCLLRKLIKNKFFDTRRLIETVSSFTESEVLKVMPRVKKENVYFLLDNTENLQRKARGDNMEFWGNCGIWDSKSISNKTTYFVYSNNRLRSILKEKSVYGIEVKKKGTL